MTKEIDQEEQKSILEMMKTLREKYGNNILEAALGTLKAKTLIDELRNHKIDEKLVVDLAGVNSELISTIVQTSGVEDPVRSYMRCIEDLRQDMLVHAMKLASAEDIAANAIKAAQKEVS